MFLFSSGLRLALPHNTVRVRFTAQYWPSDVRVEDRPVACLAHPHPERNIVNNRNHAAILVPDLAMSDRRRT